MVSAANTFADRVGTARPVGRAGKGEPVEVHSERESFRKVIELRTPEGDPATVIVTRTAGRGWLTFHGALKTTVILGGPQGAELIDALTTARNPT